jgi:hypothetical protein
MSLPKAFEGEREREKIFSFFFFLFSSLGRTEGDLAHHGRNPISVALENGSNDYIMGDVLSSVEY